MARDSNVGLSAIGARCSISVRIRKDGNQQRRSDKGNWQKSAGQLTSLVSRTANVELQRQNVMTLSEIKSQSCEKPCTDRQFNEGVCVCVCVGGGGGGGVGHGGEGGGSK